MYPIKSQRKGPQLRHDDNSEKTTPQHRLIIWQSFSHLNALSSPSLSLSVGGSVRSAHDTCLISTIIALKFAETMPLDNVRSRATHKDLHHALSHTITERVCVVLTSALRPRTEFRVRCSAFTNSFGIRGVRKIECD